MSIMNKSDQYLHTGRAPIDAKSLVKTYADLTSINTWNVDVKGVNTFVAYNGMITAVYLDRDENKNLTDKNGIYFLFDSSANTGAKKPDVTNEENWHKLGGINDLPGLAEQVSTIQAELEDVKADVDKLQDSATEIIETLPTEGIEGKIYVVTSEAKTYVWHGGEFLPVGDGAGDSAIEIQIIHGGSASTN